MNLGRRILSLGLACAALVLGAPSARAQGLPGTSEAEDLFAAGRQLMIEGRFAGACPILERSQQLEPRGGTLLNLAACHEREGRIATAYGEYQGALDFARAEGNLDRERLARERLEVLAPRLPRLTVRPPATPEAGVTVTVDGAPIPAGEDTPVDPGTHQILVRAPDREPWQRTLAFAEGDRVALEVPVLDAARPPPPAVAVEAPAATERSVVPWVVAGGGAAAIVAGVVFAFDAKSHHDELQGFQNGARTPDDFEATANAAQRSGMIANVLFLGGLLAAGTGLVWGLAFNDPKPASSKKPLVAPRGLGLQLISAF